MELLLVGDNSHEVADDPSFGHMPHVHLNLPLRQFLGMEVEVKAALMAAEGGHAEQIELEKLWALRSRGHFPNFDHRKQGFVLVLEEQDARHVLRAHERALGGEYQLADQLAGVFLLVEFLIEIPQLYGLALNGEKLASGLQVFAEQEFLHFVL
jgi:hypothetical protein